MKMEKKKLNGTEYIVKYLYEIQSTKTAKTRVIDTKFKIFKMNKFFTLNKN